MNENNNYRRMGEIEQIGVEPLPPTELSPRAGRILESWGLTLQQIKDLQHFTAQFRYDRCLEKCNRISRTPAEIFSADGREYVNLPKFFDTEGRLDGQCGDIGRQWIIQVNDSGLIDQINGSIKNKSRIVTCKYSGQSATHFTSDSSNHIWNGLALLDQKGELVGEIYIDAAFQKIMTLDESGYKQKSAIYDIAKIEMEEYTQIEIGTLNSYDGTSPLTLKGAAILGVTDDFTHGIGLSFVRRKNDNQIIPVIYQFPDFGLDIFITLDSDGTLVIIPTNNLTPEQRQYITYLLNSIATIEFSKSKQTKARKLWKRKEIESNDGVRNVLRRMQRTIRVGLVRNNYRQSTFDQN